MSSEPAAGASSGQDGEAAVSADDFRDAMSRWASGVTIVTATGPSGEPVGMTASSFTAVSLAPPLVLVCVSVEAQSHDPLVGAPGFYVHVLSREQEHLSRSFATPGPEKFAELERPEVGRFDAPLLPVGVARLACAHHAAHRLGDHTVLAGRVVRTEVRDEPPLLYAARDYHGLG